MYEMSDYDLCNCTHKKLEHQIGWPSFPIQPTLPCSIKGCKCKGYNEKATHAQERRV